MEYQVVFYRANGEQKEFNCENTSYELRRNIGKDKISRPSYQINLWIKDQVLEDFEFLATNDLNEIIITKFQGDNSFISHYSGYFFEYAQEVVFNSSPCILLNFSKGE